MMPALAVPHLTSNDGVRLAPPHMTVNNIVQSASAVRVFTATWNLERAAAPLRDEDAKVRYDELSFRMIRRVLS